MVCFSGRFHEIHLTHREKTNGRLQTLFSAGQKAPHPWEQAWAMLMQTAGREWVSAEEHFFSHGYGVEERA